MTHMPKKSTNQLDSKVQSALRCSVETTSSFPTLAAIFVALAAFTPDFSWSQFPEPKISISGNRITITNSTGANQTILMEHAVQQTDVELEDLTFSGKKDLKILDTQGASQIFYKVYLFSPGNESYVYNDGLSKIPCLKADAKKRQIVGACFHASACENWEEHYSVSAKGSLTLVERKGTYCESSGRAYQYRDIFKNGRRISSIVKEISHHP